MGGWKVKRGGVREGDGERGGKTKNGDRGQRERVFQHVLSFVEYSSATPTPPFRHLPCFLLLLRRDQLPVCLASCQVSVGLIIVPDYDTEPVGFCLTLFLIPLPPSTSALFSLYVYVCLSLCLFVRSLLCLCPSLSLYLLSVSVAFYVSVCVSVSPPTTSLCLSLAADWIVGQEGKMGHST